MLHLDFDYPTTVGFGRSQQALKQTRHSRATRARRAQNHHEKQASGPVRNRPWDELPPGRDQLQIQLLTICVIGGFAEVETRYDTQTCRATWAMMGESYGTQGVDFSAGTKFGGALSSGEQSRAFYCRRTNARN
jgi:hypothetical protein